MQYKKKLHKIISFSLISALLLTTSGCFGDSEDTGPKKPVTLNYYKLYDNTSDLQPIFQKFQTKYPHIRINYKKFTNYEEYEKLIINELAEGEGPDIFSMPNTWVASNTKKLIPAPLTVVTPEQAESVFVSVATKDIVHPDATGEKKVYGVPLYVDTLALFYNKQHFDDAIPERGKPASTWDGIKEDVFLLTKKDNSFERFFRSGIALGRSDNVSRAVDIFYLLLLQYKGSFYNQNGTRTSFALGGSGNTRPGESALTLMTSFANQNNKEYAWNEFIAQANNPEKELATFVAGKTSMVVNYSFAYEQIQNLIKTKRAAGFDTIDAGSVRIAPIPQVNDPTQSPDKRTTYASYFTEVVSRTSANSDEAWLLLSFMASKENMQKYFENTRKPTSRRDLIEVQSQDPIYGTFVNQIGYSESFPVYDAAAYNNIIKDMIQFSLDTGKIQNELTKAAQAIDRLLPQEGIYPKSSPTT